MTTKADIERNVLGHTLSVTRALALTVMLGLVAPGCAKHDARSTSLPKEQTNMASKPVEEKLPTPPPLPRDPQIAVQEEYDAAKQAATPRAWEMFLARHADNKLAPAARAEMQRATIAQGTANSAPKK